MKKPHIYRWRGNRWLVVVDAREGYDNPSKRFLDAVVFVRRLNAS